MFRRAFLLTAFLIFSPVFSRADVAITAAPVGGDVVFTATGSLQVSGTPVSFTNVFRVISPSTATVNIGAAGSLDQDAYGDLISWPTEFGTGGQVFADSSFGDALLVANNASYRVPRGYVSGTPIDSGMTFENQTLASLGLTLGTYQWVSPTSTITLNVVPEPAVAASVLTLLLVSPRRRRCGLLVRR